jgi:hypothetical protein
MMLRSAEGPLPHPKRARLLSNFSIEPQFDVRSCVSHRNLVVARIFLNEQLLLPDATAVLWVHRDKVARYRLRVGREWSGSAHSMNLDLVSADGTWHTSVRPNHRYRCFAMKR